MVPWLTRLNGHSVTPPGGLSNVRSRSAVLKMPMPRELATHDLERASWVVAYLKQGRSDFGIYQKLSAMPQMEPCHPLHNLQMAREKIAKAYVAPTPSEDCAKLGA